MATTLDVESMNPNKFTPIAKRHFILAIEGIDFFFGKICFKTYRNNRKS
jgi:hypothetical protein